MPGDAGAAIRGIVLGYLVVACGPGAVWRVAGVAITSLTALAEFSSIFQRYRGGCGITEIGRLGAWR